MTDDPERFWFGCVLTLVCLSFLFNLVSSGDRTSGNRTASRRTDRPIAAFMPQPSIAESTVAHSSLTEMRQQCRRLRTELQQQKTQLHADFQNGSFTQLQPLLTQYPTACKMAQTKPDLPASHLTALFTPLENLLQTWQIKPIGTAWEQVPFNTQLHQPDTDGIAIGEPVYVRFIGYTHGDRILCPAKVSRTLPDAARRQK